MEQKKRQAIEEGAEIAKKEMIAKKAEKDNFGFNTDAYFKPENTKNKKKGGNNEWYQN